MNQKTTLPVTYRVIRLIDQKIPHPEIASRTGLTENYVREIEAWTRELADSSDRTRGALTTTETLVFWYLRYTAIVTGQAGRPLEVFGAEDFFEMVQEFGAETTQEIAEVLESLRGKGILESLIGTSYLDILPEEYQDDPEELGDEPDPQKPETNLLDPRAWEGPPSRLLTELLEQEQEQEQEQSDDQERPTDTTLYYILRKDTLRILMETGEFIAILDRIMEEEPTGIKEDARWPYSGPIYIELTGAPPEMPEEYREDIHSFIITEDYGDDVRTVMIPNNLEDGPETIGVGLNIKTGAIISIFGPPERKWERTIELVRRLAAFLTDENNEFVEMPLSRRQRRRLQRSGQPNPWHLVRHRSREDAPRG